MAATYQIDSNNLYSTYGITVEKIDGLLDAAARKQPTEHVWPDEDGAEAFTASADIVTEPREIVMRCRIQAASYSTLKSNWNTFLTMLRSSGTRTLAISYYGTNLTVYQRDPIRLRFLTKICSDIQIARFTLVLREP